MVGCGETYFLANAVRLGATPLQQGLVITLPLCLGAGGSLWAITLLARSARRKFVVVGATLLQAGVLFFMAGAAAARLLTPELLIALACLYQACAQAAGTAWSSWYGDLVPKEVRGRYFARRTRAMHLTTCLSIAGAGFLLQQLEPGAAGDVAAGIGGHGFLVILCLAGAARLFSVLLLALSPEPRFAGLTGVRGTMRFLSTDRGNRAWRLLCTGAVLQFMVYLASPYFAPFMLEELRFTYIEYTLATMAVVVSKVTLLPAWGRLVDRHGARSVYALVAVLVSIVPLPWLWARGLGWVVVGQMLSGFSWAGYEISFLSSLLDASTKRIRPHLFAALTVANGVAQLLGGLAGAAILAAGGRNFRVVFLVSMLARLAVAALVPRLVPRGPEPEPAGRRALLLRVVGLRAHGGVVHRPVDEEQDPSE